MCKDALDWQVLIEDVFSPFFIKFNNKINFLLNLAIPIIGLLVFKLGFIDFLILFLICDIIQAVLEFVFYVTVKNFKKTLNHLAWQLKQKEYVNKFYSLSPSELEAFKETLNEQDNFYHEKLEMLNERIEEFKSMDGIAIDTSRKTELGYIEEVILKFSSYEGIYWIKERLTDIVNLSNRLFSLVKEDHDSIILIINTFNIYSEELMKIIVQYENLDEEQQKKYTEKVEDLFDVFYTHLENLETKITSAKERSIDFDIDFLTKKLKDEITEKEDIKEEDENV